MQGFTTEAATQSDLNRDPWDASFPTISVFPPDLFMAGSLSIVPRAPSQVSLAAPASASPVFLTSTLPMAVFAAAGHDVSLASILNQSLTPNFGNYGEFWITYYGAASLSSFDFSYWDLGSPQVTKWLVNGSDIGPDFGNQHFLTKAQVGTVQLQAGNDIGDLAYVMVPVAFDTGGTPTEYDQYSIITVDPALRSPDAGDGAPTAQDIVDSAKRFASHYDGTPNDNDCHKIACALSAATGAALNDYVTGSLDPTQNQDNGFWRVVYRGSDPNPVAHWQTLVQPGDIVRMGWQGGGQHTTTVLKVNANGSIQVFDNDLFTPANVETIGIHSVNYDTETIPTTITIYRLSPDHLYYIGGTSVGEQLSGTTFNDEIVGNSGNDYLLGGVGKDVLLGGAGADVLLGGADADRLNGGPGADRFMYTAVSDSTGAAHDTVIGFDALADRFALPVAVSAIDATIAAGALNAAQFDVNLGAAVTSAKLAIGHAVLFTPSTGTLAGHTFLIVDANGQAGYQAGQDYVFDLSGPLNLNHLGTTNFV